MSIREQPVVSVVIPTHRRDHLIRNAVQSVLDQTYRDLEIIVVDDCSNDNTEIVVRSIGDSRIRYIGLEKNKGAPAARNKGILAAKGDYIAFQDSDDAWHPQKLEKQMTAFMNAPPEVGVVYTGFLRVNGEEQEYLPYAWVKKKEGNILNELLRGNFVTTPAMVVRKACFEKVGLFDERLPRLQDWELAIRLAQQYEFKFISEPLLTQPYTPDSITSDRGARIRALEIILSKHLHLFGVDKKMLAAYYYSIGNYLSLNGRIADGGRYAEIAFDSNPDKQELSEYYNIVGRRLCSEKNVREGRRHLLKAIKSRPLSIEPIAILFLSYCGASIYCRIAELYRKQSMARSNTV